VQQDATIQGYALGSQGRYYEVTATAGRSSLSSHFAATMQFFILSVISYMRVLIMVRVLIFLSLYI
jgi:hypothetical protein